MSHHSKEDIDKEKSPEKDEMEELFHAIDRRKHDSNDDLEKKL